MSLNQVNWVELQPCTSADQAALEESSMIAPVNRQNIRLNAIRNLLSQAILFDCFLPTRILREIHPLFIQRFCTLKEDVYKNSHHINIFARKVGLDTPQSFNLEKTKHHAVKRPCDMFRAQVRPDTPPLTHVGEKFR